MAGTLIARVLCFLMDLWVLQHSLSTNSSALVLLLTPSPFFPSSQLTQCQINNLCRKWQYQGYYFILQSLIVKVQRTARSRRDSSHLFIEVLQRCLDAHGSVLTQQDTKSRFCLHLLISCNIVCVPQINFYPLANCFLPTQNLPG